MASSNHSNNNYKVSPIYNQLRSRRGSKESPFFNRIPKSPENVVSNNKPPSVATTTNNYSDNSTSSELQRLVSPKELIYAQVVRKPGDPKSDNKKTTVHRSVINGHVIRPPPPENFAEKKAPNLKPSKMSYLNRGGGGGGGHRHYDDFDTFSSAKPRNNVTTVLLNNVDDDETSFNSSPSRSNNYYSNRYSRNPSPPEKPFYYGTPKNDSYLPPNLNSYSYGNSRRQSQSPPTNYYSSRDVSPVNIKPVSSAFLVRDAERKKGSVVSSAKLVNTYGGTHGSSKYGYPSDKEDTSSYLRKSSSRSPTSKSPYRNSTPIAISSNSKYGGGAASSGSPLVSTRYTHAHGQRTTNNSHTARPPLFKSPARTPSASESSVNKIGLRSREQSPAQFQSHHRGYNSKSASPTRTTPTLKRGENYLEAQKKVGKNDPDKTAPVKATSNGNGGGIFSTLLRRNKSPKNQPKDTTLEKEHKKSATDVRTVEATEKEGKIKRQRAKFFSAFLPTKKADKAKADNEKQPLHKSMKPTDSEIEDAERRRDGEYQNYSSGDDEYRFGRHRNSQLTRGKSYNFGDFNEHSAKKPWYDQNDSDDTRDPSPTRYNTSATVGRPRVRSTSIDSDLPGQVSHSKSLDRRSYASNKSPPRIVITPNTPQVEEEDKWKSTYNPIVRTFDRDRVNTTGAGQTGTFKQNKKFGGGLSKSSYELDSHPEEHENGSGKLRYFGDTDAEDFNYQGSKHTSGKSKFMPRTTSYLSHGRGNQSKYYTVPGSSLNSSGSEYETRMSKGSSRPGSQRSVYLHSAAVAEIPRTPSEMPGRTMSRDEISNYSTGPQRQTKHLARSMSVLAPWRPRHYREQYELNYDNTGTKEGPPYGRPPKPPRSPTRKSASPGRAESTESLLKLSDAKHGKGKSATLGRSSKENSNISRSKSIPKDTRFAGWLRRRRFGKDKDKDKEGKT